MSKIRLIAIILVMVGILSSMAYYGWQQQQAIEAAQAAKAAAAAATAGAPAPAPDQR